MKQSNHIAFAVAAGLLLTALTLLPAGCAEEILPEEEPEGQIVETSQGKQIPFAVQASCDSDDPGTKLLIDFGLHLMFGIGDVILIEGENISGTLYLEEGLEQTSGTFRGTLNYTGEGLPSPDLELTATLVSAQNMLDGNDYSTAIAPLLDQAVQRYSVLKGTSTYAVADFALKQQTSFIQFNINVNGLASDGKRRVRISNNAVSEILTRCDTVTVSDGWAYFVAAFSGGQQLTKAQVYLDGLMVRFGGASGITLQAGKAYTVTKTVDINDCPLTVYYRGGYSPGLILTNYTSSTLQYSIDGEAKAPKTKWFGPVEFTIQFFDTNDSTPHGTLGFEENTWYLYGNVMSLIDADNYPTAKALHGDYVLKSLFAGNKYLTNHPTRDLIFPATTLSKGCYQNMFNGCTKLTASPALPATDLATECYSGMFSWCSNLSSAPVLSATTMAESCYAEMFKGCSSLTVAPELPATTLAPHCYDAMFYSCRKMEEPPLLPATTLADYCYMDMFRESGLTSAPELPATVLADYCYTRMFFNCPDLTSPPTLPVVELKDNCYSYMFMNCRNLTSAPELPAMTLASSCYQGMFWGCNNLTTPPVLPATTLADHCYSGMFRETGLTSPPELPATELAEVCYSAMFYGCTQMASAPVLPAMIMKDSCYNGMFYGCTSLTTPPELPSTTLAPNCYEWLFLNCSSLTTAPVLPATTLTRYCYNAMFDGCTSLTAAPELPATSINVQSYGYMFYGCTSLTTAPALPATSISSSGYEYMFYGCTGLTSAPELPATVLNSYCYKNMFSGCTGLTSSPVLPAAKLVGYCYQSMFSGCTNLASVKCMATDISATDCVKDWLSGVAASGTFTKDASMTSWPTGASGIPEGWTVIDN